MKNEKFSKEEITKAVLNGLVEIEKYDNEEYAIHLRSKHGLSSYSFVVYNKKYTGNLLDSVEDIYKEVNKENWINDEDLQELNVIFKNVDNEH